VQFIDAAQRLVAHVAQVMATFTVGEVASRSS
jgi:hypothetical protein